MLETVDLSASMKKKEYKAAWSELAPRIGELQRRLKGKGVPVLILLEGWEGTRKGGLVNELLLTLDPRGYRFHAPKRHRDGGYPFMIPYLELTPPAGMITVLSGGWYDEVLLKRMGRGGEKMDYAPVFRDICAFERQLADSGVVVLKFFCHIDRKEQKRRLKERDSDPDFAWSVTEEDWGENRRYDDFLFCAEDMLSSTGTEDAPWTIVAATDFQFAAWKILSTVERVLEGALSAPPRSGGDSVIGGVQYERSALLASMEPEGDMDDEEYDVRLDELQDDLRSLEVRMFREKLPVVLLFEGVDAAGKGGAIRRVARSLYPMNYTVYPTGAPNDWEKSHHYLWRFWRSLPMDGHMAIFDRSWYGRVLVERVENLCTPEEWQRAYREINEMERHLADYGTVLLKFWLQIDQEEQLKRFESRKDDPYRSWKLTPDDWRNRGKWDEYQTAAGEMLLRTSTSYAPWTVVATNSKKLARVRILTAVGEAIRRALGRKGG